MKPARALICASLPSAGQTFEQYRFIAVRYLMQLSIFTTVSEGLHQVQ
jgi:hypothetical protein